MQVLLVRREGGVNGKAVDWVVRVARHGDCELSGSGLQRQHGACHAHNRV